MDLSQTPCGTNCKECSHFKEGCQGCMVTDGIPFWMPFADMKVCPIFSCCVEKNKLEHCGDCENYPCETYMGLRDPFFTDEQWEASVADRRKNLLNRKKV